jgi:hypothetical protein
VILVCDVGGYYWTLVQSAEACVSLVPGRASGDVETSQWEAGRAALGCTKVQWTCPHPAVSMAAQVRRTG